MREPGRAGAVADDGVIEVTLELAERVVAGERLWAELIVRNIGDRAVWWQAGGGLPPATAVLTSAAADQGRAERWSGVPNDLDAAIPRGASEVSFVEEQHVGLYAVHRTQPSRMTPLAPGEERRLRVAASVALRPDAPPDLVARAVATFYDDPSHYNGERSVARPPVVVERGIHVLDPPSDTGAAAIEAFAADRRLRAFVEETKVEGVENSWSVEMVWWSDAWELTVSPYFSDDPRGQSRYRMRYQSGTVVDARRVWWDQAPEDDAEGRRLPEAPADDVDN